MGGWVFPLNMTVWQFEISSHLIPLATTFKLMFNTFTSVVTETLARILITSHYPLDWKPNYWQFINCPSKWGVLFQVLFYHQGDGGGSLPGKCDWDITMINHSENRWWYSYSLLLFPICLRIEANHVICAYEIAKLYGLFWMFLEYWLKCYNKA